MPRVNVGIRLKPERSEQLLRSLLVRNSEKEGKTVDITISGQRNEFTFDDIFDENASQEEVFNACSVKIIEDVIDGFNGCIFAYGQTGYLVSNIVD